jgi:predicted helicase
VYQLGRIFPTVAQENHGFYLNGAHAFSDAAVLMVDSIPCLDLYGKGGQFFPRYTYEPRVDQPSLFDDDEPFMRVDNVTDEVLIEYGKLYGGDVTKDDIFFFVYGLLHSPDYRTTYAADLKKMLPRIPKLMRPTDFAAFAAAGRQLSDLHLRYESVEPYPLEVSTTSTGDQPDLRVSKMTFAGKAGAWDKTTIRYNDQITLRGIPDEAHEYMLGSRSAIEWILERYRVKTDKDSGIVNDPNDWGIEHGDPEYILNLLKRIVTVSSETVAIVKALPPLVIAD